MNDKLDYKCHVNDVVEDFISHCCAFDADKYEKLAGLYKNYKHKERKGTLKIKDTCLGVANNVEILCSRYLVKAVAVASPSKFKTINLSGKLNDHRRSNNYSLNLKLVLGTMASGIGPCNMFQLLLFLDIPSCKSLHGRFVRNIELTVGSSMRRVATKSMRDAINEEVRLTLDDDKKTIFKGELTGWHNRVI